MDKTIRRILVFFLLIAAVLVLVAVQAARNISRSVSTSDWVNHTHSVILELEGVRAALAMGEGALHTYVLTGDSRDEAACRDEFASASEHLDLIKALTRLEPAQGEQITQLESLLTQRTEFVQQVLSARRESNMDKVRSLLAADAGGIPRREILRAIDRLKSVEMALLTQRDTASYLQAQTTRWTVWMGVSLDVLLLAGVVWLVRDDLAARRKVAAALAESNQQLETRVRERTAELASANSVLASENLERRWANQALEHQLHYNRLIVDSISDLVLVLTKTLRISRINPAVVRLTGLDPADLINQPLAKVVQLSASSGGEVQLRDPIVQALKDGHDLRDQAANVEDKLGRKTAVRFSLYPLRDGGKVVGGIVTLQIVAGAGEMKG